MTNFLQVFFDDFGAWNLISDFGESPAPWGTEIEQETLLTTPGPGVVRAAFDGLLSTQPPEYLARRVGADPAATWVPEPAFPLGATTTLYLHIPWYLAFRPDVRERFEAIDVGPLRAFVYGKLEVSSLFGMLGDRLRQGVLSPAGSNPATLPAVDLVAALLRGDYSVPVRAGDPIGIASIHPNGGRRLTIAALTETGPVQVSAVYDRLADLVVGGQPTVDAFLNLSPLRWPLLDPLAGAQDGVLATVDRLFPYSTLRAFRDGVGLSYEQWREIGENQKKLYRKRLLQRVGHPGPDNAEPSFEFNDYDPHNVFQLEAIVELYANFNDPNAPGATPRHEANTLDGATATRGANNVITLNGAPDLSSVLVNQDYLYLAQSSRPNRLYRITAVDAGAHTVRVHVDPQIPAHGSRWELRRFRKVNFSDLRGDSAEPVGLPNIIQLDRPIRHTRIRVGNLLELLDVAAGSQRFFEITAIDTELSWVTIAGTPNIPGPTSSWRIVFDPVAVLIDPFGGLYRGTFAVQNINNPRRIALDGAPNLARINPLFNSIRLAGDTALPSRTYPIASVDAPNHAVELTDSLDLPAFGNATEWNLPAGVSGHMEPPERPLSEGRQGYDEYEGMLFLLNEGEVIGMFPWTSYTSRDYPTEGAEAALLSSIRGNRDYDFSSFRSLKTFINFALKVVDSYETSYDGVREARYYFSDPPTDDSAAVGSDPGVAGKLYIRLHFGESRAPNDGTGSAGCVVSPFFYNFRDPLIAIHRERRTRLGLAADAAGRIFGFDREQSVRELRNPRGVSAAQWNNRIFGVLWVIRPQERAL
jgi:hypothetical protein